MRIFLVILFSFVYILNCITNDAVDDDENCSRVLKFFTNEHLEKQTKLLDQLNRLIRFIYLTDEIETPIVVDLRCMKRVERLQIVDSSIVSFEALENNSIAIDLLTNDKIKTIIVKMLDLNKIYEIYIKDCQLTPF